MSNLNKASQKALKKYLKELPQIREKVTQLSKGPWNLMLTVRHERSLFVNNVTSELEYLIDFKEARIAWNQFVATERTETINLKEGNIALQDYLHKSIVTIKNLISQLHQNLDSKTVILSLDKPLEPLKIALKNANELLQKANSKLTQYLKHFQTNQKQLAGIQEKFNVSKAITKENFLQYLKKQPAGHTEALNFYEGYERTFQLELEKLKTAFLTEIPALITDAKKIINNAKTFITNLQTLMNKALVQKNLQILLNQEGL